MFSYLVIGLTTSIAAGLTLYSGFGLGTLLMPVFALFFPVEMAVAATAIVHFANNIFKIGAVGRHADRALVLQFGIPAILAAFAGAFALGYLAQTGEMARYSVGPLTGVVTPTKLVMGALILVFALFDLLPMLRDLRFSSRHLILGGILSGFFGGFSGHQGALRSAFLVKAGVSPAAFVGTNAVIGFLVDFARIFTYAGMFLLAGTAFPVGPDEWPLIVVGIGAAFAGITIGKRFLHKVTMKTIQMFVGVLLLLIAVSLMAGLI